MFSKNFIARLLFLGTMASFACALLRNEAISSAFEIIKFPMLAATVSFIFYLRPVMRFNNASIIMLSFVLLIIISSLYNSASSSGLIKDIAVFVAIAIFFQAMNNMLDLEKFLDPLLRLFSVAVIITSILFLPSSASFIGGRFAAGFINTNVASGFIAVSLVVLCYVTIFERPRLFIIFIIIAAAFLLLLTKGRGALIAALVPVSLMLVTNWRLRSNRVNLIRLVAIVLGVWVYTKLEIGDTTDASQLGLMSYRNFEMGAREMIIERHLASFWHSPFIGVGAVIDDTLPYARTSGESSYTDLLALSGGIGALLVAALIGRALWVLWHCSRSRLGFYVLLSTLILASSEGYLVSIASAISMILWALLAISPRRSTSV